MASREISTFAEAIFLLAVLPATCSGATIVVDLHGRGEYTEIQPALDAARSGDTVLVKPGEYVIRETLSFNRLLDPLDPGGPPAKNLTLRSEGGASVTAIRMSPSPLDPDHATVISFDHGEGPESFLEGFTIADGKVKVGFGRDVASGIFIGGSSPTIRGCAIEDNAYLDFDCGAVFCRGDPIFEDCSISSNRGRGIECYEGSPQFKSCTIAGNTGLGLHGSEASLVLEDCKVLGNGSSGIIASSGASITIRGCEISRNLGCGLLCADFMTGDVVDSRIWGNFSNGIACDESAAPWIVNCTIFGNMGSGISTDDNTNLVILSSSISGNHCGLSLDWYRSVTILDCIIWGNLKRSICRGEDLVENLLNVDVGNSCIEGPAVWPGAGNINDSPMFCGWGDLPEAYVDGSNAEPGQGTPESPYSSLRSALEYSLALAENSPCLGGTRRGSETGTCERAGVPSRLIHVAPGTYEVRGMSLCQWVSIEGSGEKETVLVGDLYGLRTGTTLSHLTVTGATETGISVSAGQAPEIHDVTVTGNRFYGIHCWQASPSIRDCILSGNDNAGLQVSSGSPRVDNCAIWGNTSAGVRLSGGAAPLLVNCTIAGNSLKNRGDVSVDHTGDVSPVLKNCILTKCLHLQDGGIQETCVGTDHCLVGHEAFFVSGGVFDFERRITREQDGLRLDFPDFIVEEPDLRLRSKSPAIDAGTCEGVPDHDMDGNGRPSGVGCDIGAYEAPAPPPAPFVRGELNWDGKLDLSDMIYNLAYQFGGGAEPACRKAADVNDDGGIDLSDPIFGLHFLFMGGATIPPPVGLCGPDPTEDSLTCWAFGVCP